MKPKIINDIVFAGVAIDEAAQTFGDGAEGYRTTLRLPMFGVVSEKSPNFYSDALLDETVEKLRAEIDAGGGNGRLLHVSGDQARSGNWDLTKRIFRPLSVNAERDASGAGTLVFDGFLLGGAEFPEVERMRRQQKAGMSIPVSLHSFGTTVPGKVAGGVTRQIVQGGETWKPKCPDFVGDAAFDAAGVAFMESSWADGDDDDTNQEKKPMFNSLDDLRAAHKDLVDLAERVAYEKGREEAEAGINARIQAAVSDASAKLENATAKINALTNANAAANSALTAAKDEAAAAKIEAQDAKSALDALKGQIDSAHTKDAVRAHIDGLVSGSGALKNAVEAELATRALEAGFTHPHVEGVDDSGDFLSYVLDMSGGDEAKAKAFADREHKAAHRVASGRVSGGALSAQDVAKGLESGEFVVKTDNAKIPIKDEGKSASPFAESAAKIVSTNTDSK